MKIEPKHPSDSLPRRVYHVRGSQRGGLSEGFFAPKSHSEFPTMKSPAFQFYAADFLIGVMGMSDEEIGIYIKMLALQWERGSLPNDRKTIKKLINSRKIPSEMVMHKFAICDDGFLRNTRLEKEREKQTSFRESRAKNAQKRWKKENADDALASTVHPSSTCETDALLSSSSSSLRDIDKTRVADGSWADDEPDTPSKPNGSRRPTLAEALSYGATIGVLPETVETWFANRTRDEWMIHGTNGHARPVRNWQHDLAAAKSWRSNQSPANGQSGSSPKRRELTSNDVTL
jgi:uncharacterized protein YdaU (DUF1376 family)